MIEYLGAVPEGVRVALRRRHAPDQVDQIGIDQVRPGQQILARGHVAGDLAHDVHVAVRELERVVVAHDDQLPVLERLSQAGHGLRLGEALRAHALRVYADERPVVDHQDGELDSLNRRLEQQGRPVVQKVVRVGRGVQIGLALAVLRHRPHRDA